MSVDKKTIPEFEANEIKVQIIEYPYDNTAIDVKIKPTHGIDDITIFGNPNKEMTIGFNIDGVNVWIKGESENLFDLLKVALEDYHSTWDMSFDFDKWEDIPTKRPRGRPRKR